MLEIVAKIRSARGWLRRFIAFATGSFGALALAPYDFMPAMFVPMMAAVWLLDDSPDARKMIGLSGIAKIFRWKGKAGLLAAFDSGWWWGFGYFLAGLWWLGAAFLVDADEFAWALPIGVLGLPALLAFFPAFGFALAKILWSPGLGRAFALAAGLGLSEWLRGHLFTGFPWNLYGMALGGHLLLAQSCSVIGIYGLTIVAIAIFSLPALMAGRDQTTIPFKPILLSAAALAMIAVFGWSRLSLPDPSPVSGARIRIMQPNQPQNAEFRPENGLKILARYIEVSERKSSRDDLGLDGASLLIWPESAFPFILSQSPRALQAIYSFLPEGTALVTGAAREELPQSGGHFISKEPDFYNSILVLSKDQGLTASYDKLHLVPFGEYLPFQALLKRFGLHNLIHIPGGFTAGEKRRLIYINGFPPIVPLICYEALFPGDAVPKTLSQNEPDQPGLFLNVTDDSWFGQTSGPYQHFSQARLRAIEDGLPMLRAADSGISAIIDPFGRILSMLPLGQSGVLDGFVPPALPSTIFRLSPFDPAFLFLLTTLIAAIILRSKSNA